MDVNTLLWLLFSSIFSFIASIANIFWSVYNLHKWRQLEEFEGTASKEGDYRSLRAEQLGLLIANDASGSDTTSGPEFASS